MQWISVVSPATYTLDGARRAVLDGAGPVAVWGDIWPLILTGVIAIPLGLCVFSRGERYAKRHGRLKRSG
jgi:ABC-2 type transport system permease protein